MRFIRETLVVIIVASNIASAGFLDDARDFFASKSEGMGIPSLKLEVGASNIVMGNGILSNDANLLFYNPSRIPLVSGFDLTFSHSPHILDMHYSSIGMVWGDGLKGYGLGVNYFSAGDIELRNERQKPFGTYSPFSLISYLAYGRKIGDAWLGASFKYIYEKSFIYSLRGYAVDIGFSYVPISSLIIASSISNIGPGVSFDVDGSLPIRLPLTFKICGGYEIGKFGLSGSIRKALDEVLTASIGAEYILHPYITLRMGNRWGYDSRGASFGVGINHSKFSLDYAYLPYGLGLGSTHHITVSSRQ